MHFSSNAVLSSSLLTLSFASSSWAAAPSAPTPVPVPKYSGCPIDGPLLPRPTNLSKSRHVQAAAANLTGLLDSAVSGEIKAGWNVENVSFSISFASPYDGEDTEDPVPFWEYHHLADGNVRGTMEADGDSQYLIGSVSKVFSDLLLLKSGLNLEDPVTKYLPELKGGDSNIAWDDITLASMSEHLSGIPPNFVYEFFILSPVYEAMGFPHIEEDEYPDCGVIGLNEGCTIKQLIKGLRDLHPVAPVNSRPVYSQLTFTIFTYIMEKELGLNYSELLDKFIINPLGMSNSGPSPGVDEVAVIPPGETGWGSDYGINAPGGGMYSSTNDLIRLTNAVLDKSVLDTDAESRKWLKPRSSTSSPSSLVGQPWEILRTTDLTPKYPHTIDIYAKNGGAQAYAAQMSVIDQYGVGAALLTAGPYGALNILNEAALGTLLPAIEEEAREQAQKYLGNFTNWVSTSPPPPSEAVIEFNVAMDDDSGLKLQTLTRNGSSILDVFPVAAGIALQDFGIIYDNYRLYPSEIETRTPKDNGKGEIIRQDWRIHLDVIPTDTDLMSDLPAQGVLQDWCSSWMITDWLYYGGESFERVVFEIDSETEQVIGVEIPFLRSGLLTKKQM
ncbi:hypothetical protein FQN54_004798 [Arachnomyces sp. PD_36]|nr:hypothetical protein FQN54_004798 [Arachnomyces sp. PD_36]